MNTYGDFLADFEDPAKYEIVPADEATREQERWYRDGRRQLGAVLRPYLESGVTWYELAPVVMGTQKIKAGMKRAVAEWPAPAVYVLRPVSRTLYACDPDDGSGGVDDE